VFTSMVNISGPSLSVGPLTAARRLAGGASPPLSRDSTPALPPLTIAHGAQVHVAASSSAAAIRIQQRPLPLPGDRAASADSVRKIR
jgi:hypothetical protein